jgi:hypothetical protein
MTSSPLYYSIELNISTNVEFTYHMLSSIRLSTQVLLELTQEIQISQLICSWVSYFSTIMMGTNRRGLIFDQ